MIGDRNVIREFVTISRGTGSGGGTTRVGNDNWLLAYTHVAHDCRVGDHCVFSNNSTLAGHVEIGDWVIMSGFAGVHQFCRIGAHAFLGMGVLVSGDVPPFTMVASDAQGRPRGINSEGLKRRGFDAGRIAAIKRAYRALYIAGLPLAEARGQLARTGARQRRRTRLARIHRARRAAAAAMSITGRGHRGGCRVAIADPVRPGRFGRRVRRTRQAAPGASRWWRARLPAIRWAPA